MLIVSNAESYYGFIKCFHMVSFKKFYSEEDQKLWSKTFNKMLSIISLLAVAAIWFSKTTSLPKIYYRITILLKISILP